MSLMSTIGTTVIGGSSLYTIDIDDKKVDSDKRNQVLATTLASTATVIASEIVSQNGMKEIHQKYSQGYIESLSDEELASALQELDLLEKESTQDSIKTI